MTTLSKEVIESVADKYDFSEFSSEFKTSIEELYKFVAELELLVRADLVAENKRLKEELQQVTISKDCYFEERNSARAAFHRRVKEVESLQSELTATRTALTAAEAQIKELTGK